MPTTFTATKAGPIDDGNTFGNTSPGVKGTDWPAETDYLATGGYALTQGAATQVACMTGGGGLTLTGDWTCPDQQNVKIIIPTGVTSTLNFGTAGVSAGFQWTLTTSAKAIQINSGGTLVNVVGDVHIGPGAALGVYNNGGDVTDWGGNLYYTGTQYAINNSGTWADFSGTLINSGSGKGVSNGSGTWTDFSGTLTNSGAGKGAENGSTWTDFSGQLTNSGSGIGFYNNAGTVDDFTGTLTNTGTGIAANNASESTWTAFTGILELGSMATTAIDGDAIPFSGIIRIKAQADLDAGNIKTGKTILNVAGSLTAYTYGDNDAAKVLNTAVAPGTFDEASRNTDPGVDKVEKDTSYKILNVAKVGTKVSSTAPSGVINLGV